MKKLRSYHLFFEVICSKNNLLNLGNRLPMRLIILLCLILTNLYSYGIEHSSVSKHKVTKAELAAHNRTVHVKDGWLRDPYIVKSPDGNFYFTGTTQLSTRKELPEDKPEGYRSDIWPLWFVAYAFDHNKKFGGLFLLGLIAQLIFFRG